jgi:hypothetical protein
MQAVVEDLSIDTSRNRTVEGASVDFAVNNSTVGTLSPSQDVTDGDGEVTTELTAENNGTVRVYAVSGGASDIINVTFTNITGPTTGAASFRVDDLSEGGPNEQDSNEPRYVVSYNVTAFLSVSTVQISVQSDDGSPSTTRIVVGQSRGGITFSSDNGVGESYTITVEALDLKGDTVVEETITDTADGLNPTAANDPVDEFRVPSSPTLSNSTVEDNNRNKVQYKYTWTVSDTDAFDTLYYFALNVNDDGASEVSPGGESGKVKLETGSGVDTEYRVGFLVVDDNGAVVAVRDARDTADGSGAVTLSGAALLAVLLLGSRLREER